jgi:hypothetical protein
MVLNTLAPNESAPVRRPATRLTATLFFLTFAACVAELFWAYNQLPERVHARFPSWLHVGAEGPKWIFVTISGTIPLLIAIAALLSIRLVKRQSEKFVQIPNRDYWMSRIRREQTLDLIASRIYLLGAVKFIADAIFIYAAVQANLTGTSELNGGLLFFLAAGFVIAKLALAAQLFWRFQFPNEGVGNATMR